MTTTTTERRPAAAAGADSPERHAGDSVTGVPDSATTDAVAATGVPVAAATDAVAATAPEGEPETRPKGRHRGLMIPLAVLAIFSGLAAAVIGFALSYGALRAAAADWGFGPQGWKAAVFPVAVDGLIIALYTADLVLAWRRMARPWVRMAAHAITAVTIVLNAAAAAGSAPGSPGLTEALGEHPARLVAHAGMPIAYVILTEVARWAIVRTAELEAGGPDDDRLTLADWVLRLPTTWKVFKHAKTWPATYSEARTHVRDLAIYRIWLRHREEIEAGMAEGTVGVLDRMPQLLAPYGVSVEAARALPALMQERERQRQEAQQRAERERQEREERQEHEERRRREQQAREDEQERQRQAREDEHAEKVAKLAAEAEETRLAGELAVLRARTTGQARAAEAEAEGAGAAAEMQARTALAAVQRAATEEERRAEMEEAAIESERAAEAKRRAAEHTRATAEETRRTAEETARTAKAHAEAQSAAADKAEEKAREEAAVKAAAADREEAALIADRAAAIEARAAETARLAAATRARAAEAEALSDLGQVQIKTRVAARVLLSDPDADGATLAAALGGASPSTASTYRKAALELISQGYPDHDPDLTAASTEAAPVTIPGQTEITV
ncbi:DUF2637 domain-containing protein [Streptomyces sp. NPDC059783]|uniref:DUF2637 domain-containing protein n=1 Tax=Streptomyces sp. NPDC059783 TaxID=3346944 RepID=UPI00365052B5